MANNKAVTKIEQAIKTLEKNRGNERNAAGIAFARKLVEIIKSSKTVNVAVDATERAVPTKDIRVSKTRIDFTGEKKFDISLTHMRQDGDVIEAELYDDRTSEYVFSPVTIIAA